MTRKILTASAIMASLIAASCQDDSGLPNTAANPDQEQHIGADSASCGKILMKFAAGSADTACQLQKTYYAGPASGEPDGTVFWNEGDQFSIFPAGISGENDKGSAQNISGSECTISASLSPSSEYYAIYPYSATATLDEYCNFHNIEIPANQKVSAGQYDPAADVMAACTDATEMKFNFKHIGAKLAITIPEGLSNVTSIRISCSEKIAGKADVSWTSGLLPQATITSGSRSITLSCSSGFQPGSTYYACLFPTSKQTDIKIKFFTDVLNKTGKVYKAKIGQMKRATRNFAAPPATGGREIVQFSKSITPIKDYIKPNTATKVEFGYLDKTNTSGMTLINTICSDKIEIYQKGNEYYFLSDCEICSSGNIERMFNYNYPELAEIIFKNFDTENVTTMAQAFCNCEKLTAIDLSGFCTDNVTNMGWMFSSDEALTSIDLSGFDTEKVTDMTSMFSGCKNLTTIYASDKFKTGNVSSSSNMFEGCTNLVGSQNQRYNADYTDKTYARIDGANGMVGYFTAAQ